MLLGAASLTSVRFAPSGHTREPSPWKAKYGGPPTPNRSIPRTTQVNCGVCVCVGGGEGWMYIEIEILIYNLDLASGLARRGLRTRLFILK